MMLSVGWPSWYSWDGGLIEVPCRQVVTEMYKIILPDENKLPLIISLTWNEQVSCFGRIAFGGNIELRFEMNLKGLDRWEQYEQRQR